MSAMCVSIPVQSGQVKYFASEMKVKTLDIAEMF